MSIISAADLKDYMRNEIVAVDDVTYTLAASGATDSVQDHCGRQFAVAGSATARLYRPDNTDTLRIHDCTTITSVTADGSVLSASDWQAEPLNHLSWDGVTVPYEQILRTSALWYLTTNTTTVSVTATWGWAAIPSRVTMAALIIGKDIIKQREVNSGVADFGQFGAVRVRENPIAMKLLERLVRVEALSIA